MVVDRPHREVEAFGDRPARLAGSGEHGDLAFAVGERNHGGGTGECRRDGSLAVGDELTGTLVERCRAALLAIVPARIGRGRHRLGREQVGAHVLEPLADGSELPRVAGRQRYRVGGACGDELAVTSRRNRLDPRGDVGGADPSSVVQQPCRGGKVTEPLG